MKIHHLDQAYIDRFWSKNALYCVMSFPHIFFWDFYATDPATPVQPCLPEQLIHSKSSPISAEAQSEGDQALYLADNSPSLEVVTMTGGWHQHFGGI